MKKFHQIIQEICIENKINFRILSKDWFCFLEKDGKSKYIAGYKFDLNGHGIGNVLDDKYAFYEVLLEKNYPTIVHHIIFRNYQQRELVKLFEQYGGSVVIKSNTGTCGNEVFHIENLDDLFDKTNQLLQKHFSISICPFYFIKNEYRLIILDEEVKVLYGKSKPVVIGNGTSTVRELLIQFNPYYFKKKELDDSFEKILPKGQIFEYSWKFNLSQGSTLFLVNNSSLKKKLSELALTICKNLGLSFCSVDIIETENHQLFIMEANSGVMMDSFIELYPNGYEIAKRIYQEAIMKMMN